VRVNGWRPGALFAPDPHRVVPNPSIQETFPMLKKLLVALVASAFALGAYAQAPKSDTKADTTKTEKKAEKKAKSEKKAKKAKSEKTKADAKDTRKDATKEPKKEATK
jgi:Ni/Co efflux regulator RcnB